MALSAQDNNSLRDVDIDGSSPFDQFLATDNTISTGTPYEGLAINATGIPGHQASHMVVNNASIDANMASSRLPDTQVLLAGGHRPDLKLNLSSQAEAVVSEYPTFASHSQAGAMDISKGPVAPNYNVDETFPQPGSLSPLSAVSPLSRSHSPGPYPPPSPAPSAEAHSPYPHSPEGHHSSGGISPAHHSPHGTNVNGISPQALQQAIPAAEDEAPRTPASAGKLRGRNSMKGRRPQPPQVQTNFYYDVQNPPQGQHLPPGYVSAGPVYHRNPVISPITTTISKRNDDPSYRFSRSRGQSVGSGTNGSNAHSNGGGGGHARISSGQMHDMRRGRVGTSSVGASRSTSPYPRPHELAPHAEAVNMSNVNQMGTQSLDQGHGLGLALSMTNLEQLSNSFPQSSITHPSLEVEKALSNAGSVDAGYGLGGDNEGAFMMDPAHSVHFLAPPTAGAASPHHAPVLAPHSPVSPVAMGSPSYLMQPPDTPGDYFSSSASPIHSPHGGDANVPWGSHHSSPAMHGGMLPPNGAGPNHSTINDVQLDFNFAQSVDPLPTSTTAFTAPGTSNSGTSGFPGSAAESQFFAQSQQSQQQQQQQQQYSSVMQEYNPTTFSMSNGQGQDLQDYTQGPSLPLTAAHLEAHFGNDSGNNLNMSERANSGIGHGDWDYNNDLPTQTINFPADLDLPPGAHTPAPLMDTFSSNSFNQPSMQQALDNNLIQMQQQQQQQGYNQGVPPSPLPNTLPWDQSSGQLSADNIHQFQRQQQHQLQQQQQQFQMQSVQPPQQKPMQADFLHPQHAHAHKRTHPTRRRSQSASDINPIQSHQPNPGYPASYNQNILGENTFTAPPGQHQFTMGGQEVYLGGQTGANLRAVRSFNVGSLGQHRKALSNIHVPSITVTADSSAHQGGFPPHHSNRPQPMRPSPVVTQSSPAVPVGDPNSFYKAASTSFQPQQFTQQQLQQPPLPHGVSYPPPVPAPPLPNQSLYYHEGSSLSDLSLPSMSGIKPKQQGQRAEVDEKLLRDAFTSASLHPDAGLRALLDIVRCCPFYLDEELEPAQGTPLAEQIFEQVRFTAPNDPRFASRAGAGPHASTSTVPGDPSNAPREAQSIYMLFTENNVCLICGKKTDRSTRALGHVRSDIGHRPFHCDCDKCSNSQNPRSFFSESLLDDHRKGQVVKQKCPICGNEFRRGGITRHMDSKHADHPDNPNRGKNLGNNS